MFSALNKKLLWVIVIWFGLLQTISPFIHGHVEADTPAQGHGLHMHIEGMLQAQDQVHTLKNISIHAIGVDKALVKNIETLPLPIFAVLFVISLFALAIGFIKSGFVFHPPLFSYLRPQSRPRAPPTL